MKNKEGVAQEPDLQEIAGSTAAADMVEKLRDLQDVASRHGFEFLVYMLDIARAEAERLRQEDQHRNSEKTPASD